MAFASLAPEVRAPQMMRDLSVSGAFIAALVGIEASRLSLALRQLKSLSNEEGRNLMRTLVRLQELKDALAPLQLDLRNAANCELVMKALEGADHNEIRMRVNELFRGELTG